MYKKLIILGNIKFGALDIRIPDIGRGVRVFANGPGDLGSIPGRVIPKTQKMVLDASLLNTQHYKVRIKGKVEQSREGVAPSPTHWCSSYWKGSLRVTLDNGRQLYLDIRPFLSKFCSLILHIPPALITKIWYTTNSYAYNWSGTRIEVNKLIFVPLPVGLIKWSHKCILYLWSNCEKAYKFIIDTLSIYSDISQKQCFCSGLMLIKRYNQHWCYKIEKFYLNRPENKDKIIRVLSHCKL